MTVYDPVHHLAMLVRAALCDSRPGTAPTMAVARRELGRQLQLTPQHSTADVEAALRAALEAAGHGTAEHTASYTVYCTKTGCGQDHTQASAEHLNAARGPRRRTPR